MIGQQKASIEAVCIERLAETMSMSGDYEQCGGRYLPLVYGPRPSQSLWGLSEHGCLLLKRPRTVLCRPEQTPADGSDLELKGNAPASYCN